MPGPRDRLTFVFSMVLSLSLSREPAVLPGTGMYDKDIDRWQKRAMEDELRDPSNFLECGTIPRHPRRFRLGPLHGGQPWAFAWRSGCGEGRLRE